MVNFRPNHSGECVRCLGNGAFTDLRFLGVAREQDGRRIGRVLELFLILHRFPQEYRERARRSFHRPVSRGSV